MAQIVPGTQDARSKVPVADRTTTSYTWKSNLIAQLYTNIVAARGKIGMPASYHGVPVSPDEVYGDQLSPRLYQSLIDYANSEAAAKDQDVAIFMGSEAQPLWRPAEQPGDTALTDDERKLRIQEEQLQLQKQAAEEARTARLMGSAGGGSFGSSGGTVRISGGGGGGGGSSSLSRATGSSALYTPGYDAASAASAADQARLDEQRRQFDLDYALRQQSLAAQIADSQQAARDRTLQRELDRGKTVAQLSANPGDAVQREYFTHLGTEPTGTPVDVFTGARGTGQKTLSQLMAEQAPLLSNYLQAGMNGTPAPAFAGGTRQITPDGWTKATKFIAGDPAIPGRPNPEMIRTRIGRDGRPEAKVIPLSRALPQFADGTDDQALDPGSTYVTKPTDWEDRGGMAGVHSPTLDEPPLSPLGNPDRRDDLGVLVGQTHGFGNAYDVYYDNNSRAYTPVAADGTPLWSWSSAYDPNYDPQNPNINPGPWVDEFYAPAAPAGQLSSTGTNGIGWRTAHSNDWYNQQNKEGRAAGETTDRWRPDPTTGRWIPTTNKPLDTGGDTSDKPPEIDTKTQVGGFRNILSAGTLRGGAGAPDAYIQVRPGDVLGRPDPTTGAQTVLRWNSVMGDYEEVPWSIPTDHEIRSSTEWTALPEQVRQDILDGRRHDYFINDTGMGAGAGNPTGRIQTPGWFGGWTGEFRPLNQVNSSENVSSPYGLSGQGTVRGDFGTVARGGVRSLSTGLFRMPTTRIGGPASQDEGFFSNSLSRAGLRGEDLSSDRPPDEFAPGMQASPQPYQAPPDTPRIIGPEVPDGHQWFETEPDGTKLLHQNRRGYDFVTADWQQGAQAHWYPYIEPSKRGTQ